MSAGNNGLRYRECWRELWGQALRSGGPHCYYCGISLTARTATIDHLLPISRGGAAYDVANMALCCEPCNQAKGTMTDAEFRAAHPPPLP